MQKGYAGYSLIKDDGVDSSSIGHAVFCPNCGTEIATVFVNFLPPHEPEPGSRLAILSDIVRSSKDAQASIKKARSISGPAPVESIDN